MQVETMDHWHKHAHQWQHVGPPLRPCDKDIQYLEQAVSARSEAVHALLLGVTPEIAAMRWPPRTRLTATDRNLGMIRTIWPGTQAPKKGVACADWLRLPFADGTFDMVVGDGCFTLFSYPEDYRALAASIRRVLKQSGLFCMRYFLRPDTPEDIEQVFDDLHNGDIGNFHVLKWRLAQALHGGIEQGVRLANVWDTWHRQGLDVDTLAREQGWTPESILTINAYRGVDTYYTFPTLREIRAVMDDWFAETGIYYGNYELGERCPMVTYRAR